MKIYSAEQIRQWDQYTIEQEPIASIDLMERAARACFDWLDSRAAVNPKQHYHIFCGKGNNGGDGLALARMLLKKDVPVSVFILEFGHLGTPDFQTNLSRLQGLDGHLHFIQRESQFPKIERGTILIDALYGTGMNRPLEGLSAALVEYLNQSGAPIIAIDLPSGLCADTSSRGFPIIRAQNTLSFQTWKLAFLLPENESFPGNIHFLDIGLHPGFESASPTMNFFLEAEYIRSLMEPRTQFMHKGNFGHAALVAGKEGTMGAAVLAARACLRSGAGKLTCYAPACGRDILQTTIPEAMVQISGTGSRIEGYYPVHTHEALGIGPGIGTGPAQAELLRQCLTNHPGKLVLDADALTLLAQYPDLQDLVPENTILTPHPGEWVRLFGQPENDFQRISTTKAIATQRKWIIILKGHYSFIALPAGQGYFNSTGNPGMATAGSGDVLTGILTGLLARGYDPEIAALIGTFLHGLAGDLALDLRSQEGLIASDIIENLGRAFQKI